MKLSAQRRSAIDAWTSGIRERANARRIGACIACGGKALRACHVGDPERGAIGCYWCPSCNALAFGSDSFIGNLSARQLEGLPQVGTKQAAVSAPRQGKLL